jgi:hypothetical protein
MRTENVTADRTKFLLIKIYGNMERTCTCISLQKYIATYGILELHKYKFTINQGL